MDVVFERHVADDAVGAGMVEGDALNTLASAGDERHTGASRDELSNKRQPQTGGAAGDSDPQICF